MRRLNSFVGIPVLFLVCLSHAQQSWTRTYGGSADDHGFSVQQTTDGGYVVGGYTSSYGAGYADAYLVKTNASGDTLWMRTYGGAYSDAGRAVRQTSDGGYIVTGVIDGYDAWLVKTDASGDTIWTRRYPSVNNSEGLSVQQTSDGGYIVAGYAPVSITDFQVYLVKTNASGDTLWTRTYGGGGLDFGYSVQQTTDGGYVVAGYTTSFGNARQVCLIKTNASGDTLWTRTYGGTGTDDGYSVRQTADGGYIVAGTTGSFGVGGDVYLIKTGANGNVGVEEKSGQGLTVKGQGVIVTPNPFTSFARLPGHEAERFDLYDISGKLVGVYKGDRVGEGLAPGVYFLKYQEMLKQVQHDEIVRIVKVR